MLLDSNIIIYAALPEHESLRRLISEKGTALANGLTLVTRNTEDFAGIEGLSVHNPLQNSEPE